MATRNPWRAAWTVLIGWTAVSVANPSMMATLHNDYGSVVWVTSAYLLGFAVPLLTAGRQRLVAARVLRGVGAALPTPQTMLMVSHVFPAARRGDEPVGQRGRRRDAAGATRRRGAHRQSRLAADLPRQRAHRRRRCRTRGDGSATLPVRRHRFDVPGVLLSGIALFLVVFALQDAESRGWAPWIWGMIAAGVVALSAFVYWQLVNEHEPLVPLNVFGDRDFAVASLSVA